jgi:hypothetical protein
VDRPNLLRRSSTSRIAKILECTDGPWFTTMEFEAKHQEHTAESALELVLATGERLRIGAGVDTTILRTVLDLLRV